MTDEHIDFYALDLEHILKIANIKHRKVEIKSPQSYIDFDSYNLEIDSSELKIGQEITILEKINGKLEKTLFVKGLEDLWEYKNV